MADVATRTELAKVVLVRDDLGQPFEVVINRGAVDGVQMGDDFLVFAYGPEITDPDTRENLGPVELVRGRGRVVHVQGRLATLRSVEKKRIRSTVKRLIHGGGLAGILPSSVIEDVPADLDLPFSGARDGDFAKPV